MRCISAIARVGCRIATGGVGTSPAAGGVDTTASSVYSSINDV